MFIKPSVFFDKITIHGVLYDDHYNSLININNIFHVTLSSNKIHRTYQIKFHSIHTDDIAIWSYIDKLAYEKDLARIHMTLPSINDASLEDNKV